MNIKRYVSVLLLSCGLLNSASVSAEFERDSLTVNGFITQGFFYTDHNNIYGQSSDNGSWNFRELAVNASYRFTPRLRGAVQLMSRRAGAVDDGTPQVDYALLDYRLSDVPDKQYGVRLGRLKIPFGFYNETRDVAFTRPSIMLPQSLYFDQARDLELSVDGGIFYSYVDVPGGRVDIDVLYGMPKTDTNVEYAYLGFDAPGQFDESEGYMARAIYNDDSGAYRIGATVAKYTLGYQPGSGPGFPINLYEFDKGDMVLNVAVLSAQYNAEKWSLTAEYMLHDIDWREMGGIFTVRPQSTIESFYIQGQYRLSPEWDLVLRYDELYLDKSDPDGVINNALFGKPRHAFYSKDWTLGVGWSPSSHWLIRAEYHHVEGTGWLPEQDNPDSSLQEKDWNIFALQATYRF